MASIPIELKRKHTHKVITPQACRYLISVQGDRSPVNCDGNICVPFSMGRKRKVQDTKAVFGSRKSKHSLREASFL